MSQEPRPSGLQSGLFYLGAVALLIAMSVDAVAVLGRHVGMPLLGSIELVQAAILVAASAAIVAATLSDKHAAVHFIIDRLSARRRAMLKRILSAVCAIFFLAMTAGSTWIAFDLRDGYEESELLHIPYAPLRVVAIAATLAMGLIYARRIFRKRESR